MSWFKNPKNFRTKYYFDVRIYFGNELDVDSGWLGEELGLVNLTKEDADVKFKSIFNKVRDRLIEYVGDEVIINWGEVKIVTIVSSEL